MKKRVYIETTVISYLTSRPSQNLISAAWQNITWEWWSYHKDKYEVYISEVVMREAEKGDANAVRKRLDALSGIPLLKLTDEAVILARKLIDASLLPSVAIDDALHIAIAVVHEVDYLLTWNYRHIDNAETKPALRSFIVSEGFDCPELTTPQDFMGGLA